MFDLQWFVHAYLVSKVRVGTLLLQETEVVTVRFGTGSFECLRNL